EVANASSITVSQEYLTASLDDGRMISIPISWYPRLFHATEQERRNFRLIGSGSGIHWVDLDEDISIESIIAGRRSAETQASLERWMRERRSTPGSNT
ncbi:MAG: DUF2442 domain-containing protein, partial [Spirochaetales bacterium]